MEVPQVQCQEVVRHVISPQVVTQEVVRQVPVPQLFIQTVEQPYSVPQVMTQEVIVPMARPYPEYVNVPYANPILQTMVKIVGVPQVQFLDPVPDVPVVTQGHVPLSSVPQEQV